MNTDTEHRALAEALHVCAATVARAGYVSDLDDHELYASGTGTNCLRPPARAEPGHNRTEVLWSNRPLRATDTDDATADLSTLTEFRNEGSENRGECNETRCPATEGGQAVDKVAAAFGVSRATHYRNLTEAQTSDS
ncbi:hypothetical protein [Amycolatopsis sp. NPDC051372]|uniref:hypothetical protein n=1 Tax=Amycolatopsis sp. NPDC051372 TaxID=3155669 RepID=UPI003427BC74